MIYISNFLKFDIKLIIMENISLSNSCINCVNLEDNKCSIHHVEVSAANTCDTFTTT